MGISCIKNNLTWKDYLEPQAIHASLMAFFASLICVFAVGSYWIFAADGVSMLVQYPSIDAESWSVEQVKLAWCLSVGSGIVAMAVLMVRANRASTN